MFRLVYISEERVRLVEICVTQCDSVSSERLLDSYKHEKTDSGRARPRFQTPH